ncbi:MAG: hypothetical protein WC758_02545 [Candidatus Woesearchaeota archaeon]|jgi:hypothetical protein
MGNISGWIFMAVGAAVSLFSRYVQKRGGDGLGLFFWVGVIMIGIGVFKIITKFILRDNNKLKEEKDKKKFDNPLQRFGLNKDLQGVNSGNALQEQQKVASEIQAKSILVCNKCGTKHYSTSNFCHICGSKLR